MILIYGKWHVGNWVGKLCDFLHIPYEMKSDEDVIDYSLYDTIIPSPWIPWTHNIYTNQELRKKIICELDFSFQFLPRWFKAISITGTDGKSTTAWILYELLRQEYGNEKVYLSGNFDIPFSETVCDILINNKKKGYIVLEISSFMSYAIGLNLYAYRNDSLRNSPFQSDYSIFTNFEKDHQNWHKDMQEYLDAKMNLMNHTTWTIVANQQIITRSEELWLHCIFPENTRYIWENWNDRTDGENIIISGRKKYHLSETRFSGFHNAMNILACTVITNSMKICSKRTLEYLKNISWLPHRLERVTLWNGITFIDDSKSTSAQSLQAALQSFPKKNLLLIVGWSDKWDSFTHLWDVFTKKVLAVACIWATKDKFIQLATNSKIPYLATDNLKDAVSYLLKQAQNGDILLLSPGCASFWLFRDYLDRANQFRSHIFTLTQP